MFLQILAVQQESADWLSDAIRSIFWWLTKGVLFLLDGMFAVIDDIWRFKFFDNPYVNKIYSATIIVACTWIILKVLLEIVMHYFVNQDDNSSPTRVFKGIIISIVLMFLVPPLFNWGYDLSSKMTQYVVAASSSTGTTGESIETSMASMILTAFADNDKMYENDKQYFIKNWKTVDYNEVVDDGLFDSGKYKYSFSTFTIMLVGLVVVVLLVFIGIQVAKRVIELALYKAIAPFVCTSMVSNRSRAFEVWAKGVMGAFLVTTVQYLCIGILFNVFGQVSSGTSYAVSVVIIVIGALLFIISSPQLVSALLNANTGAMSNMSELHTLAAMGTSMIAMSKFGKSSDNSTNTSQSNDNSTSTGGDSSSGGGADNSINSNNASSNFDNSNMSNNSNSDDNSSSSNNENSNSDNSSSSSMSDLPPEDMTSNISDNINMDTTTSLSERIDAYKDITDSNYSFNNDSGLTYKTNIDWGNVNNVSDTEEHKS